MILTDIDPAAVQAGRLWNKLVAFNSSKAKVLLLPFEVAKRSGLVTNEKEYDEMKTLRTVTGIDNRDVESLCRFYFKAMLSCVTIEEGETDGLVQGHVLAGANWANQLSPRLFSRSKYGMLWFTDAVKKMLTARWKTSLPVQPMSGRLVSVAPLHGFLMCSSIGILPPRLIVEATSQIYVISEVDSMMGSFVKVGGQGIEKVLKVVLCGPGTDVSFASEKGGMRNFTGYRKEWTNGETLRTEIGDAILRETLRRSNRTIYDQVIIVRSVDHLPHDCAFHVYGVFINENYNSKSKDTKHGGYNDVLKEYATENGIPLISVRNGQHLLRKIRTAAVPLENRSKYAYVVDHALWKATLKKKNVIPKINKCSGCADEQVYWICKHPIQMPVILREPKDGDVVFIPGNHCSIGAGLNIYFDAIHTAIVNVSVKTRKRSVDMMLSKLKLATEGIDVSGHLLAARELPVTHFCLYILSIIMNLVGLYQSGGLYEWGEGQPHLVWHTLEDYKASVLQAQSDFAQAGSHRNKRSRDLLSVTSSLLQEGNFVEAEMENHRFLSGYDLANVSDWNSYDLATLFTNWFILNWDKK
jgi:hypothetical protein